ncbi:MBL fold metallo-hydrolase [Flavobacterium sp. ZT3R17]|uniref:MBL fold metallo-hydrolase n=1 Tax=Flavobacterium cryoconiti TaxID=3398736 RepID=UPI003A8A701F
MELHTIGTGSLGNCYILGNKDEQLLIECGVGIDKIKKGLDFDYNNVVGCLVTHEHGDHFKSIQGVLDLGIDVYASAGTFSSPLFPSVSHRKNTIAAKQSFKIGNFKILPFSVVHDAAEPLGFIIEHPGCGKVLFLTDTNYCKYTFPGLNNIIIEANFSKKIIEQKFGEKLQMEFLKNRILKNHFSLEDCKVMLAANDLSKVNNIVLIHLSDSNSHEVDFRREVYELTGKNVSVADKGRKFNLGLTPF